MKPRPQRVLTPETVFDRVVAMAIERGKLAEMIFDNPEKLSHRALGRWWGFLEQSPVFKPAMAVRPIRLGLPARFGGGSQEVVGLAGRVALLIVRASAPGPRVRQPPHGGPRLVSWCLARLLRPAYGHACQGRGGCRSCAGGLWRASCLRPPGSRHAGADEVGPPR